MNEFSILLLTFISVLIVSVTVAQIWTSRSAVAERLRDQTHSDDDAATLVPKEIRGLPISDAKLIQNYYQVIQSDKDPNSLQNRLIRAGYFQKSAVYVFQFIRVAFALAVFTLCILGLTYKFPELSRSYVLVAGLFVSAFAFFIAAILLEREGNKRERGYRLLFPDFMDTLIVCVDAGLSVEAALDRVAKEFLNSQSKDFGLHLAIMLLEVRGGRRLRDALSNLAKRLRIEEAQSLAVLFRQSEELGASVTKALRVFSQEMRDKRMIRAEEKANALPFKMLLPLAAFLFPVSVLIVAVPIMMKVISVLKSMAPPT